MRRTTDLAVALIACVLIGGLAVVTVGRMTAWTDAARRAAELELRLAAARRLVARDLRQDGYGLGAVGAIAGLPLPEPGEIRAVYADGAWGVVPPVGGAPPGAIPLAGTLAVRPGETVVVVPPAGEDACSARVVDAADTWIRVDPAACPAPPGTRIARLVVHRYRVASEGLQRAEGFAGAWRTLAPDVEALTVVLVAAPPAARGTLYRVEVHGQTRDASGAVIERAVSGRVLARNRARPGRAG